MYFVVVTQTRVTLNVLLAQLRSLSPKMKMSRLLIIDYKPNCVTALKGCSAMFNCSPDEFLHRRNKESPQETGYQAVVQRRAFSGRISVDEEVGGPISLVTVMLDARGIILIHYHQNGLTNNGEYY